MNEPDLESENDTEIWALYNAVGMASKPDQQWIRLTTLISRVNSRILGENKDGSRKELSEKASSFRERARELTMISPAWKETTVLGKSGFHIQNTKLDITVPCLLSTITQGTEAFLKLNMIAQNPALAFLVEEMVGFAQAQGILDPKKKRNSDTFKNMLNRYSGSSNDWFNSGDTEFVQ